MRFGALGFVGFLVCVCVARRPAVHRSGRDPCEDRLACAQVPAPPSWDDCAARAHLCASSAQRQAVISWARKQTAVPRVPGTVLDRAKPAAVSSGCGRSVAGLATLEMDSAGVPQAQKWLRGDRPPKLESKIILASRFSKSAGSLVPGRAERYAKHRCAKERCPRRNAEAALLPGAGWHCCASGRRTIGPSGRDRCSGDSSPRHGARRSRSRSDRAAPLGERCQSVLHHGAPGRRTTGRTSSDTNSARKVPRPQHHA